MKIPGRQIFLGADFFGMKSRHPKLANQGTRTGGGGGPRIRRCIQRYLAGVL